MKILFFGDVVGKTGRNALAKALPELRTQYEPDFVIVNAENATHGKGLGWNAYRLIQSLGVDCITGGDHIFDVQEIEEIFKSEDCLIIRPANYPAKANTPGNGYRIIEKDGQKLGVINLQGRVFMKEGMDSPFVIADELLEKEELKNIPIFVDFHTEATSEIAAMGWHLDGRVTAVVGTHTHVQTNDARILPKGTAFLSDVGMCGPRDSIIGVKKEIILEKFLTAMPVRHEIAEGEAVVSAIFIEADNSRSLTTQNILKYID